jgi:hypothetical protein
MPLIIVWWQQLRDEKPLIIITLNWQLPETTTTDCKAKKSESDIKFECPCGECSLETYLQRGCPKSCIPYTLR